MTVEVTLGVAIALAVLAVVGLIKSAIVVPQQQAYVIERLGKFHRVLDAGVGIIIPFLDRVAHKHSMKEQALDIPEQICITKDNVQVGVDGVIYFQVLDPRKASYGIEDYLYAISQLAQTTLRSEMGRIELDKTFEARSLINAGVVSEIDKASAAWGAKILRYEIMNINPPKEVLVAMETQVRAEREKRARILESEGFRDSEINKAEGEKQRVIKESEAKRLQQIYEAEGQAKAILAVAQATSAGVGCVADVLKGSHGEQAMLLRLAEQYIEQFGKMAKEGNTLVIPANVADIGAIMAMAMKVKEASEGGVYKSKEMPTASQVLASSLEVSSTAPKGSLSGGIQAGTKKEEPEETHTIELR